MPPALERLAESGVTFTAVLIGAAAVFVGLVFLWRRRNNPDEKERRRRLHVNRHGRTTSGVVMDIAEDAAARLIHYTYRIGAVEYSACQDVTALDELVGHDPSRIVGPAQVRYQKSNPYNSIVICEEWTGLRGKRS
jgi:hypothetical protein